MSELNQHTTLVLVPAYNVASYLPELIVRIKKYVCDEHLLVINDGSTDESTSILKEYNTNHISFDQNRGKGAALKVGFEYAMKHGYRSVLTIQHLPEEIPRFFALDNGRRVVVGTRHITLKQMPFARWLTNNLTSIIISIFSSQRVRDSQSGYRLIPTSLLKAIQLKTVNYDFESEMLFKAGALGYPIVEVPISTVYEGSHSYINPLVDTLRFIRQIFKRVWV
jgi:glycosyltransferase involved in cell wall biosynthesis